jgi:hypothetical protein
VLPSTILSVVDRNDHGDKNDWEESEGTLVAMGWKAVSEGEKMPTRNIPQRNRCTITAIDKDTIFDSWPNHFSG